MTNPKLTIVGNETPAPKKSEVLVCSNCGNRPEVPQGLVIIVCALCGGRFSTSIKEWE